MSLVVYRTFLEVYADKIEFSGRFTNFLPNNKSRTDHPPPRVRRIEEKFERTVLPPADTFQMNDRMC